MQPDRELFGALGHGITDTDTGKLLTVSGGMLYDTSILKIVRGQRGTPGELSGMITYSDSHAEGVIRENTSRGIFGQAEGRLLRMLGTETVEVAFKQESADRQGSAQKFCFRRTEGL